MTVQTSRSKSALPSFTSEEDLNIAAAGPESDTDDEEEAEEAPPVRTKGVKQQLLDWIDNDNIARDIDADTLQKLGRLVLDEYEIDEQSRSEWKDEAEKALKFAVQKSEPKQYPWPEASNVIFPLITSAAMRFGAVAYPAIVPNRNVAKGVVWGSDKGTPATQNGMPDGAPKLDAQGQPLWLSPPGSKAKRADRVGEHMSYQLLEVMDYWEGQTDSMLHSMPIIGGAVRKTYRNVKDERNESVLVNLMDLVWNMDAKSFEAAPRHSEIQSLYPHEIEDLERYEETFLPLLYGPGDAAPAAGADPASAPPSGDDSEAPHTFIEQHRRFDLDGDGYPEPLIVTVHKRSGEVVRIVVRYEEDGLEFAKDGTVRCIKALDSYTLYPFLPNPQGGSYPCGFGHYLKPLNESINTTLNQMFDAGHLQIAGGGFIGTGLSVHAGPTNFSIGEYKPVNAKGGNIRDNIYPIPWPGPSEVLFQLLGFLVGAGKEVASTQDALTGDHAMANTPPTTMLALVDQGMKVYTAIYKRIYRALKSELAKIYRLNRLYLEEDERYRVGDTWMVVSPEDYRLGGGVIPYADPTMVTDMQRLTRAALITDRAKNNPLVNPLEAERYLFEAAQIPRIDDFLPSKMPPPQESPEMIRAKTEQTKAKQDDQRLQFDIAESKSKLGLTRAQEMQAYTQALVNLAKAKSSMSDEQVTWAEQQLNLMRLHIESLNTTVKAAEVDARMHADRNRHRSDMTGHAVNHAANMADTAARAREIADDQPEPGPANTGGGGGTAAPIPQPLGGGGAGGGIPAVAPSPGNPGVSPLLESP